MKVDWIETFGCSLATAVLIVLMIKVLDRGAVAPGAMLVVAGLSATVTLGLFVALVFDSRGNEERRRVGLEMRGRKPTLFDDEWGTFGTRLGSPWLGVLRLALWLQFVVAAFAFGSKSMELLAAGSGFAISILLTMRQLKGINSSQ